MALKSSTLFLLVLLTVFGCRFGQLPNPNAAKKADPYDGKALQERVMRVAQVLNDRVMRGQLQPEDKKRVLGEYVRKEVAAIDFDRVKKQDVWRFADVVRQSGDWKKTRELYEIAAANAKNDDRRVNDGIRLAEAMAMLDEVPGAITVVRSTFDVKPGNKGPILMATLYEFAPAALGKGNDVEVALLLEDAVDQHLLTVVDPETEVGQDFMRSRRHHVDQAWKKVLEILHVQGSEVQFREAIERSDETLGRFARV